MLHNFVTVCQICADLVSKDARYFKEKSNETAREDLLLLTKIAKEVGGGGGGAMPQSF